MSVPGLHLFDTAPNKFLYQTLVRYNLVQNIILKVLVVGILYFALCQQGTYELVAVQGFFFFMIMMKFVLL